MVKPAQIDESKFTGIKHSLSIPVSLIPLGGGWWLVTDGLDVKFKDGIVSYTPVIIKGI